MDTLFRLQQWYASQCDGDWEHGQGVQIGTLDNPGWTIDINLTDTALEFVPFAEVEDLAPEIEWVRCWVEGKRFRGVGGVPMLDVILRTFLDWAEGAVGRSDGEPGPAPDRQGR